MKRTNNRFMWTCIRAVTQMKGFRRRLGVIVLAAMVARALLDPAGVLADAPEGGLVGYNAYLQQQYKAGVDGYVSLFTGAATYSYSIAVPPGTNGMQPSLALVYSSQAKNGWTGWGWDIAGLSAIERSTKKGVPKYDSPNTDTFVLGDDLVLAGDGTYHTRTETFTKVTNTNGFGASSYWEAWTKGGTYMRFGYDADSRIEAVGKGGAVRVWAVDKVMDTNGNYMEITYAENTTLGGYYPSQIKYTLNAAGGITNYRYVKFFWASRNDVFISYGQGALVEGDQRLDYIETYIGGTASTNRVNKYQLGYTTGSGWKSLLSSVKVYSTSADTTGLPPTSFAYKALTTGFGTAQDWGSGQGYDVRQYQTKGSGSFDGNIHDLLDVNGDGLPDDVYRPETGNYTVRLNTGSGFGTAQDWGTGQASFVRSFSTGVITVKDLLDINGDGLPDDVYRTSGANYSVRLNTGSGFAAAQSWGGGQDYDVRDWVKGSGFLDGDIHDLLDVNGDGLPDDIYRTETGNYSVRLNTGSGFAAAQDWGTGQANFLRSFSGGPIVVKELIDINGDGLPDDVYRGSGSNYSVRLNTGSGFAAAQNWGSGQDYDVRDWVHGSGFYDGDIHDLLDVNGDGLPDDVYRTENGNYSVRLNMGSGFLAAQDWGTGQLNFLRSFSGGPEIPKDLLDINGDGLPDDVYRTGNGSGNYSVRLNNAAKTDLLTTVTLPTGGTMTYAYGRASAYTNQRLPFPMWVVTSVTSNDGLGVSATSTYSYYGALYKGYPANEFRGFQVAYVSNPDGSYGKTYFRQGNVYKGLVDKSYVKDSSTNIYSAVTNEYDYVETNNGNTVKTDESTATGGVYLPRLRATNSYSVEGATTDEALADPTKYKKARSTYAYDTVIYGNVTDAWDYGEYTTGDVGYDKMRSLTGYINDTTRHILGVPEYKLVQGYDTGNTWVEQRRVFMYYDNQAYGSLTKGNLTKTESYWDATNFVTATMGYDNYGNLIWTKDARANAGEAVTNSLGHTTDTTYDTTYQTFAKTTRDANDFVATVNYDSYMRPTEVVDINGISTYTEYDNFGRVTAVRQYGDYSPNDPTVKTEYHDTADLANNKPAYVKTFSRDGTTDATYGNGLLSYTFVDGLGRTIQSKSEGVGTNEWYTVDTRYNTQGRLDRTSVSYTTTSTTPEVVTRKAASDTGVWTVPGYDVIGRVNRVTKPDTSFTETLYGRWQTTVKDELGHQQISYVDGLGMVTKVEEYMGTAAPYTLYATTTNKYNTGTGELVKVTDTTNSNISTMTYDKLGRKTAMTDPDLGSLSYGYDKNGNLTSQTDAKSQTITLTYDKLNRVTKKAYPTTYDTYYGYDASWISFSKGRLSYVEDRSGGTNNQYSYRETYYDQRGRVSRSRLYLESGKDWSVYTSYDSVDRVSTLTYPDGEVVTFRYNKAGKLDSPDGGTTQAVQSNMYTNYAYVKDLTFTANGNLATIKFGNDRITTYDYYDTGTETELDSNLTYTYRVKSVVTDGSVQSLTYGYDKTGNVKRVTDGLDGTRSATYTYDTLSTPRLTGANATVFGSLVFGYNNVGNLTVKDTRNYTYPAAGSARPHAPTGDGTYTYTYDNNGNMATRSGGRVFNWDYNNMLTSVVDSGVTKGTYAYAEGARIKKVENGVTTYYVGNIYEEDWSGGVKQNTIKYYYANGQKVAKRKDGTVTFIHGDHLGSASRISNSSGALAYSVGYKPYGEDAYTSPSGNGDVDYRFTGQEKDLNTGLYYYGARYYEPVLGRFISADSVVGLNRYMYANNNPVKFVDPTGSYSQTYHNYLNQTSGLIGDVRSAPVQFDVSIPLPVGYEQQVYPTTGSPQIVSYPVNVSVNTTVGAATKDIVTLAATFYAMKKTGGVIDEYWPTGPQNAPGWQRILNRMGKDVVTTAATNAEMSAGVQEAKFDEVDWSRALVQDPAGGVTWSLLYWPLREYGADPLTNALLRYPDKETRKVLEQEVRPSTLGKVPETVVGGSLNYGASSFSSGVGKVATGVPLSNLTNYYLDPTVWAPGIAIRGLVPQDDPVKRQVFGAPYDFWKKNVEFNKAPPGGSTPIQPDLRSDWRGGGGGGAR